LSIVWDQKLIKRLKSFFPDRIERENFFFPKDLRKWKEEVCEDALDVGFIVSSIEDFIESERYKDQEELMDLIEMVPLVKDFNRKNNLMKVQELVKKYGYEKGVKTTWHYYIMMVQKP
jgi:Tfp pilus assembly ATPase PilU